MKAHRLILALALAPACTGAASAALYSPTYDSAAERHASTSFTASRDDAPAVAIADVNGDDVDDLVSCSPSLLAAGATSGGCVVTFGPIAPGTQRTDASITGSNGVRFCGECGGGGLARFGEELAVGDINGDGRDDVVSSTQFAGPSRARIHALFGRATYATSTVVAEASDGTSALDTLGLRIIPPADAEQYNYGLALLDLDDDGFDDVVTASATRLVVLHGGATLPAIFDADAALPTVKTVVRGFSGNRFVRFDTGDVNGDGVDDLVIADSQRDAIQVVFGRVGARRDLDLAALAPADGATIRLPDDGFAESATTPAIGDFTGDGVGDVAVLVSDPVAGRRAVVLHGGPGFASRTLESALAAGSWQIVELPGSVDLRSIPDIDGDGRAELSLALQFVGPTYVWFGTAASGVTPACALRADRGFRIEARATTSSGGPLVVGSRNLLTTGAALVVPASGQRGSRIVDLATLPNVFGDGFGEPCG
jgi:hypothetical protein